MLIDFTVANWMSFRFPVTFSMVATQERHFYCNVSDASGCCATMIRFDLADNKRPQPKPGDSITIRGHFVLMTENGKNYGVLQETVLE